MVRQYLNVLIDSLHKKDQILDRIICVNEKQTALIKADSFDESAYDQSVEEKDKLIAALEPLDDGFESVDDRIKSELSTEQGRKLYINEIRTLKGLISAITDKSMAIQAAEERNKKALENYFEQERARIKNGRIGTRTAMSYYNNMKNRNFIPPQFLDSKN